MIPKRIFGLAIFALLAAVLLTFPLGTPITSAHPLGTKPAIPKLFDKTIVAPINLPLQPSIGLGSVETILTPNQQPGEIQSTIVGPGKKNANCPNGRLLVSNDVQLFQMTGLTDHYKNIVTGRDLDKLGDPSISGSPDTVSDFRIQDTVPNNSSYLPDFANYYAGQDHDLVSLSNGDVFLLDMAISIAPLTPKPLWFDGTWAGTPHAAANSAKPGWGPGARTVILTWESTDCGSTFYFVSQMDPANVNPKDGTRVIGLPDGTCALPQSDTNYDAGYIMGGTDGQLAQVDPSGTIIYLVHQCVGNKAGQTNPKSGKPSYAQTNIALNKTLIATYVDTYVPQSGSNNNPPGPGRWVFRGFVPIKGWRMPIVPQSQNLVALGVGSFGNSSISLVDPTTPMTLSNPNSSTYQSPSTHGWQLALQENYVTANVDANTVMTHSPGQDLVMAEPDNDIASGKDGYGYSLLFFHTPPPIPPHVTSVPVFIPATPILPQVHHTNNFVMHLTMINPGPGLPILLYWYDVNQYQGTASIWGRFIYGDSQYSGDFEISDNWTLAPTWYGDYHTASGYLCKTKTCGVIGEGHYYPIWVQIDNSIHFADVSVTGANSILGKQLSPSIKVIGALNKTTELTLTDSSTTKASPAPLIKLSQLPTETAPKQDYLNQP